MIQLTRINQLELNTNARSIHTNINMAFGVNFVVFVQREEQRIAPQVCSSPPPFNARVGGGMKPPGTSCPTKGVLISALGSRHIGVKRSMIKECFEKEKVPSLLISYQRKIVSFFFSHFPTELLLFIDGTTSAVPESQSDSYQRSTEKSQRRHIHTCLKTKKT